MAYFYYMQRHCPHRSRRASWRLGGLILVIGVFCAGNAVGEYTSAGLVWPDGVEPGTPSTCENPGHCWYVDCDAVADGTGTYASPFWGFETVFGYINAAGSYVQGSADGGDYVYVKGTCGVTGSVDDADGPYKQIRVYRKAQIGTTAAPTVLKSYLGTARAIFDGEYTAALVDQHRAENAPTALIKFAPTTADDGQGVLVQNLLITRAIRSGIEMGATSGGGTVASFIVKSVEFKDNNISANGTESPLVLDSSGEDFTQTREVVNCLFDGNDINCAADGGEAADTTCTAGNNDGALDVYSNDGNVVVATINIHKCRFTDNTKHIRAKHNGSADVNIYDNYFGQSEGAAIYDRQADWTIHHNLFVYTTPQLVLDVTIDAAIAGHTRSAAIYNNSFYNVAGVIGGMGAGAYTDLLTWEVYNNAMYATASNAKLFTIGPYSGDTFTPAKFTADHNYWYVNATVQAAASCFAPTEAAGGCSNRSLADTNTYISDTTSSVTDPLFVSAATGDLRLQVGAASRTAGRDDGYIGATNEIPGGAGNLGLGAASNIFSFTGGQ